MTMIRCGSSTLVVRDTAASNGVGDGPLAEAFYAALPEHTRFVFDLLMDRPGERLTSDWIAAQLTARRPGGTRAANRGQCRAA